MGLDLETCLEVFDYRAYPVAEVRRTFQQSPRELVRTTAYCEEELIGPAFHEYFRLHRLRGHGDASWSGGELMLLIVVSGEADLRCGGQRQPVREGQTWLLPGAAPSWNWTQPAGDWEILLAKLPVVQSSVKPIATSAVMKDAMTHSRGRCFSWHNPRGSNYIKILNY